MSSPASQGWRATPGNRRSSLRDEEAPLPRPLRAPSPYSGQSPVLCAAFTPRRSREYDLPGQARTPHPWEYDNAGQACCSHSRGYELPGQQSPRHSREYRADSRGSFKRSREWFDAAGPRRRRGTQRREEGNRRAGEKGTWIQPAPSSPLPLFTCSFPLCALCVLCVSTS